MVKAEEARIAALLGADTSILGDPGLCKVRLLGQKAGASFVWATCEALDPPYTAISAPLLVDDSKVTMPGDGAAFSETVREMFPRDLAVFVLNNQDSPVVRPSATQTSFRPRDKDTLLGASWPEDPAGGSRSWDAAPEWQPRTRSPRGTIARATSGIADALSSANRCVASDHEQSPDGTSGANHSSDGS